MTMWHILTLAAVWDSSTLFWAETARTVALAIAGYFAVVSVVKPSERKQLYNAEIDKKKLEIKTGVIDDFLRAANTYTAVAYDALHNPSNTVSTTKFKNDAFDDFQSARRRMDHYFNAAFSTEDAAIQKLAGDLFKAYKTPNAADGEAIRKELMKTNRNMANKALKIVGIID